MSNSMPFGFGRWPPDGEDCDDELDDDLLCECECVAGLAAGCELEAVGCAALESVG